MIKFNQKEVINNIKKYLNNRFINVKEKDFYNLITHKFTCGICNKIMSSTRALFHWHLTN